MDHGTFRELAAGAVLDDLDPGERLTFEAHRATCRACRELVDDLLAVTADLALAAAPRRPPRGLHDAVMANLAVGGAGATLTALPAGPVSGSRSGLGSHRVDTSAEMSRLRTQTRRLRVSFAASLAAAAVLAAAAFGLGARSLDLGDQLASAQAAASSVGEQLEVQSAAMAVAVDPAHETCALHAEPIAAGASAVCVYRPGSAESYLMASALPPTPDGMVYQLWYADAAGVHALGTYAYDGRGAFVAPFTVDLADAAAVMVTLEPVGGATGEPGPEVIFGEL